MTNEALQTVASRIATAGGKALLVGGAVIDRLQGRQPKDLDIEVFGLPFEKLALLFADCNPNMVGRQFGVLKITLGAEEFDLSIPRRENKTGAGHKGFEVQPDPTMTSREAARRRDFTINSISIDLATGEVVDPFGGLVDLEAGVLRVTDPTTFVEDPLRVLRAMQILPRKARSVDPASMRLMQGMADSFPELAPERVFEEFRKLLLKADRPSIGLEFLRESGWLRHFPELEALIGCEQREEWHPEGDVWTHSGKAVDAAASVRHLVPEDHRESFMFGTWLHDIGKPLTTVTQAMIDQGLFPQDRWLTAHGHDQAGIAPATEFLTRLRASNELIERTTALVAAHMTPNSFVAGKVQGLSPWLRLERKLQAKGTSLAILARTCQCDACASALDRHITPEGEASWSHSSSHACFEAWARIEENKNLVQPLVLGRHLIERGVKPGIQMGKLLKDALEIQFSEDGLSREAILARVLPPAEG